MDGFKETQRVFHDSLRFLRASWGFLAFQMLSWGFIGYIGFLRATNDSFKFLEVDFQYSYSYPEGSSVFFERELSLLSRAPRRQYLEGIQEQLEHSLWNGP